MNNPNPLIALINARSAASKLTTPAPNKEELADIFSAAFRAPDHANLTPARFKVIQGEGLDALGALFVEAEAHLSAEQLSEKRVAALLAMPKRAPMIIVASASIQPHKKVPTMEQLISAGCSVQNSLLAIDALGYNAIWRTGPLAYNDLVHKGLNLTEDETLIGFIYVGTRIGEAKVTPSIDVPRYIECWPNV